MKQQYNLSGKDRNTVQMLHMVQHVCLTVRLMHSTHMIDERQNKTN